ncbi:tRNA-guanine(15) transglycosylase-like protein [Kalaharituber pfeilii]|nr:tRNA-guanine(15) transglycosylase-like protein [Kalaharituber pfeilii]
MFSFSILPSASVKETGPRLGRLVVSKSHVLDTPTFIAPTSRGAVPHLSHDTLRNHTQIKGIYAALEDFVEKPPAQRPIYTTGATLRQFICLPETQFSILAPRRSPPVATPATNSDEAISILTSVGYRFLTWADYTVALKKMKPDIAVSMPDLPHQKPGKNRGPKMVSRTELWLRELLERNKEWAHEKGEFPSLERGGRTPIFAPLLPLELEEQRLYLEFLEERKNDIAGLAVYDYKQILQHVDSDGLLDTLKDLPRLSLDDPLTPLKILDQIEAGIDLFNINLVGDATDAGIALDFYFPVVDVGLDQSTNTSAEKKVLGLNLWNTQYATDLSALSYKLGGGERNGGSRCECYACSRHHRAYVQHLLNAKEMTAWVLLQIHNYTIINKFFAAIRESITNNTFSTDRQRFVATYVESLPERTGQGPRIRGYQFQTQGGAKKKNPTAFRAQGAKVKGGDKLAALEDADTPDDLDAGELEERGMASKVEEEQE